MRVEERRDRRIKKEDMDRRKCCSKEGRKEGRKAGKKGGMKKD